MLTGVVDNYGPLKGFDKNFSKLFISSSPFQRRSETEVKPRAYFFEFLTHFSILKLDWSMKRHRHAIALAGAAHT